MSESTIAERLRHIARELPPHTRLVAVSKGQGEIALREALQAGQRIFGENRVQEAQEKWPELKAAFPDCRLHLIGPLQSNKVKAALSFFDCIQTVDRPALVDVLAEALAKQDRAVEFLIQVNTGVEPQKAGVTPDAADALIALARQRGLAVTGLMCIPPAGEDPAPHFALLRAIALRNGLVELSMGMSGDYHIAAEEGATMVRIGTAIFGSRN